MNNKLLIGLLIVLLFVFIIIVPHFKPKEDFTMYRYPNTLMASHVDFINSKSNQYSNIFSLFNEISNIVFQTYENDENKDLDKQNILQEIFNASFNKFESLAGKPICNATNENEECKLFKIILQFINEEYVSLLRLTVPTDYTNYNNLLGMNLFSNDTDIENKLNFSKVKDIVDTLFTKTLVSGSRINSFTIIRKEIIIKKLVKNVLFNIYFTIYPSSVGGLACPLYTADTCPSVPYQPNSDNGSNAPTLPSELIDKYKCKIDTNFSELMSNLCVNNDNNKYITNHCETMNGYGKIMCENTLHQLDDNTVESCKFENLTQKCVNSDVNGADYLNTRQNAEGEYEIKEGFTGHKCHLIYHSDLDKMKNLCESQSDFCEFHKLTDSNSKNFGVCMAKK